MAVGSVEDLQAMADAIAASRMKPVIDKVFSFDQVKQAFAHMESGAHSAKWAETRLIQRTPKMATSWSHATLVGRGNCFRRH